jgi:4-amino-4-deoxy-L-arabinose transferase-like glycosyltransferase
MPKRSRLSLAIRKQILFFSVVFLLTIGVRVLTFNFLRARLHDAGWFQYGSYHVFDKQANDLLDGRQRLFWINDPSRTDLIQYPPAYPWMVAAVYRLTGDRSAYVVQTIQSILDLILSFALIIGVAVTAFGWPTAMAASILAALSPLLAIVGVSPAADAPTTWFVVAGLWLLLIAIKRVNIWWAFGAGILLGIACWLRVNPLYLCIFWILPLLMLPWTHWRRRLAVSAMVFLGTVLIVSPIVVRNYLVFPDFTPTGGTIGANLWEGLGETELGRSHGFVLGDEQMVEHERVRMGLPADFPIEAMWPDGIKRERERTREALGFIKEHPVWYSGVIFHRMWGMLKVAGAPLPYYGTSGINVTSRKCLPASLQGGVVAILVTALGMIQSVARYLLLPLAAVGIWLAAHRHCLITSPLVATILYYLVPGTIGHTEIRYVLTLHWLLPIFAGLTIATIAEFLRVQWSHHPSFVNRKKQR